MSDNRPAQPNPVQYGPGPGLAAAAAEREVRLSSYKRALTDESCRTDHSSDPRLDANKRLVRRMFLEIINKRAYAVADEIFAADFYWPQFNLHGPDGVRSWMRQFHSAFPDVQDVVELQVAEGDMVVTLLTVQGTHLGNWLGNAPTGRFVVFPAIGIDRVRDGRIVERSATSNTVEFLQQAGIDRLPAFPGDTRRFEGSAGFGEGREVTGGPR